MTIVHPASIQARVGNCLHMMEVNIEQQDLAGLWNFQQQLESYTSIYEEEEAGLWLQLAKLPLFAYQDDGFELIMARQRICLKILNRKNIFGYVTVPMGDSSELKEMLAGATT